MLVGIFRRICSFMFFVFFLNGSVIVFATDYYIDSNNGDDENDGTSPNSPWKTLSKVSSMTFQPGDNIYFKRGTMYSGCAVIKGDGTKNNPITVSAYGSGNPPKFTNPNFNNLYGRALYITGDYIIIDGLFFYACGNAQPGESNDALKVGAVFIDVGSDHITVRNCEFYDCAIGVNTVGLYTKINNNNFYDFNRWLWYPNWGPIGVVIGNAYAEVSNNTFSDIYKVGGTFGADGGAIEIDDRFFGQSVHDVKIHHNVSSHCYGFLEVESQVRGENIDIYYNVSYDYQQFVFYWGGHNSKIENNTVIRTLPPLGNPPSVNTVFCMAYGFGSTPLVNDHKPFIVRKNIFVVGNGLKVWSANTVPYKGCDLGFEEAVKENNLYYCIDGSTDDPHGLTPGPGELVNVDPKFVGFDHDDYHLQPDTPCPDWGAYPLLTGGFKGGNTRPEEFGLRQNYPNPFNSSTTITFGIPVRATVQISIYNMLGQIVSYMDYKNLSPGIYSYTWDSRSIGGILAPSGVYFCELTSGNRFKDVKKMILLR